MDISAVTSDGKSCQSIATKEICIFVANDDLTSCDIVVEMLQGCTYEVLHVGEAADGLKAMWERKDKLGLILTNVHRFNVEAFKILQNIQKQSNLRTILMPPDEAKIVLENRGSSFTAYVLKFSNVNDFHNLWQSALVIEKPKWLEDDTQKALGKAEGNSRSTPTIDEATQVHYKRKREANEKNEDNEDGHKEKKPRMVWTKEMHQKFVRAIEIIGYEKAFPKKILEVMNVPDLRRENVASHLQKYRMSLKRVQDCSQLASTYGMALESYAKEPCFSSGRSALHFNSSQGYSHLTRPLYRTQFCPGIPRPAAGHAFDVDANVSTFRSNLSCGQEVSTQGSMHQLCTPNASFSSSMPQKNNHADVGNLQCIDQNGLMQYQSRYAPYKIMLNSNFRVYNDQKKNVLFSFKSGSSSVNCTPPASSDSGTDFLGFRFTSDGKIEFGKTGSSSNNSQIKTSEMLLPNRIQLQTTLPPSMVANQSASLCPSTTASCLLEQQPSVPSLENYSLENLVQLPSLLANCKIQQESPLTSLWIPEYVDPYSSTPVNNNITDQQQLLLPLNHALGGETSAESSTMAANFVSQHQSSAPPICSSRNVDSLQYPSARLTCDSRQLNPMLTFGTCEDETTAQRSSMAFIPYQETFVPPLGSPVNDNTVQAPSTYLQCVSGQESPPPLPPELHEINSFGANGDLDVLLNATGSPSTNIAELFWDDEIDDMLYKVNINGASSS